MKLRYLFLIAITAAAIVLTGCDDSDADYSCPSQQEYNADPSEC